MRRTVVPQTSARPPCRYFRAGHCANPRCAYSHDTPGGADATATRKVVAGKATAPRAPSSRAPPAQAPRANAVPQTAMAPLVKLAGERVAAAAMGHIAGRTVLDPQEARATAARPNEPCRFFMRTGTCERGDACKYVHDPTRVALCRAFLRGACPHARGAGSSDADAEGTVCPLSHERTPERTPTCVFFMRGLCTDSACAYAHVAVSRAAPLCANFCEGFCARGEACTSKHLLVCDEWVASGTCPRGELCLLKHTHTAQRSRVSGSKRLRADDSTQQPARRALAGAPLADTTTNESSQLGS